MTSRLRKLDTPQWLADHERRLAALERRGRAVVTDPPRRPPEPSGSLVAGILRLNNSTGARNGSNRLEWDSAFAVGDRSWFEFPYNGTDETNVSIQRPGMAVATLTYQTSASVDVELDELKTGIQALASEAEDTISITVAYYTSFEFFDADSALIRAEAVGNAGQPVFSALTVVFYDDFPWSAGPSDGWKFKTTEGW